MSVTASTACFAEYPGRKRKFLFQIVQRPASLLVMMVLWLAALGVLHPAHAETGSSALAGYKEDRQGALARNRTVERDWESYFQEKEALNACGDRCGKNIAAFFNMIEAVKKERDKLLQIELINAWVNLHVAYDHDELRRAKSNSDHRTMKQALIDGKGVCNEIARLKMFGLEQTGFAPDDIRVAGEALFIGGKAQGTGHAVATVRLNGKTWIMNILPGGFTPQIMKIMKEEQKIALASKIETAEAHLNFSGNSYWAPRGWNFVPSYQYNADQHSQYIAPVPRKDMSNVPTAARDANAETRQLDTAKLKKAKTIME